MLKLLAPGAILPQIGESIGQTLPLLLIGGGFIVWQWLKARRAPDEQVTLRIGRGGDD